MREAAVNGVTLALLDSKVSQSVVNCPPRLTVMSLSFVTAASIYAVISSQTDWPLCNRCDCSGEKISAFEGKRTRALRPDQGYASLFATVLS